MPSKPARWRQTSGSSSSGWQSHSGNKVGAINTISACFQSRTWASCSISRCECAGTMGGNCGAHENNRQIEHRTETPPPILLLSSTELLPGRNTVTWRCTKVSVQKVFSKSNVARSIPWRDESVNWQYRKTHELLKTVKKSTTRWEPIRQREADTSTARACHSLTHVEQGSRAEKTWSFFPAVGLTQ